MIDYTALSRDELVFMLKALQEQEFARDPHGPGFPQRPDRLHKLLESLRLYQFRLERQNKNLREAHQELEQARNHLGDLYDFAPIGYITLDEKGCIQQINNTGAKLLGTAHASLVDRPFLRFVRKEDVRAFILHLDRCRHSSETVTSELGLDLPDIGRLYTQISSVRVPDHRRRTYVYRTVMTDISERKRTEQQLQKSLREKEVLLKEVHHRVKNNLQIISSLLKLQSGYVKDQESLQVFHEMQDTVRSMALIHEKLYRSEELSSVNYAEYINEIATNLFRSYGINTDQIRLSVDVADVAWGIDTAIPVGLIINELISNALKYAFPDGREGEIAIRLYTFDGMYFTLVVSDNGIGIPEGLAIQETASLGLQLVAALVEELQGKLTLERYKGTRCTITFTIEKQTHQRA